LATRTTIEEVPKRGPKSAHHLRNDAPKLPRRQGTHRLLFRLAGRKRKRQTTTRWLRVRDILGMHKILGRGHLNPRKYGFDWR
jgi:hypothetical protein